MSRLPRFQPDQKITGKDLNVIIAALDAGGLLNLDSQTSAGITGQGLTPTVPTTTSGSTTPAPGSTGAPQTPTGLTYLTGIDNFSQTHDGFIVLSWTPNPVSDFVARYDVYWHKGADQFLHNLTVGGDVSSVRINSLVPGQTYIFAIQAHDAANRASNFSMELPVYLPLDIDPPAVPTGLVAIGTTKGVSLFWNEVGSEGVSNDLKQYQIQVSIEPNFSTTIAQGSDTSIVVPAPAIPNPNPWLVTVGPGNSYFYPFITPNTTLYFRIRSVDWTGNVSNWSASTSATTDGPLTITGLSTSSIGLTLRGDRAVFDDIRFTDTNPFPLNQWRMGIASGNANGIGFYNDTQALLQATIDQAGGIVVQAPVGANNPTTGRYVGAWTSFGPPTGFTARVNDFGIDGNGAMWVCTSSNPATWITYPLGTLGYQQISANGPTSTGAVVDFLSAPPVNVGTGRRIRISAQTQGVSNVNTDAFAVYIFDGATQLMGAVADLDNNYGHHFFSLSAIVTPSAGQHFYKLSFQRVAGTGTCQIEASNVSPSFILVEDIGV